ncbi:hypothetical protein K9U40_06845 [Xanthobacter autotrophicus]|uniref:hypothetical protein n=1 Tax=Xanthobacter TaxID=279 RepID=UPI0024AB5D11|nr:hypothetical protein [Xanthobacter autotrophicus]MDI4664046.1 hypothetical protein [Xanthobacter autotrophicus]
MARRALTFKQADIARAVKGVASAGVKVMRVEIDPNGKITVVTAEDAAPPAASPLDNWMARRGSR